jgi:hypothetical protein
VRRVRDRRLPYPFRAWINRDKPLPQGVTVLPRTIDVSIDGWRLVYPGLGFVGMGVAFIVVIARTGDWRDVRALAFLALSSLILFGAPIWMACRLWRTIGAQRDQRAGTLRQGVLVGPEGILVRLTPNRCYPMPLEQFVTAEEWSGGGEDPSDWLRITTRDGPIDIPADHMSVGSTAVNRAVSAARRALSQSVNPGCGDS